MNSRRSNGVSLASSALAGAVGGLVGAYAMNQFQSAWSAAAKKLAPPPPDTNCGGGDDATVKTAQSISRNLVGAELTPEQKKWAGPAVHYAFGTTLGIVYGIVARSLPAAASGYGTAYGSAVWLGADEIGVPAFGLSESPAKTPMISHVKALASHLVYGFVLHGARQLALAVRRPSENSLTRDHAEGDFRWFAK